MWHMFQCRTWAQENLSGSLLILVLGHGTGNEEGESKDEGAGEGTNAQEAHAQGKEGCAKEEGV